MQHVQRPLLSFGPKASIELKTCPTNVCKLANSTYLVRVTSWELYGSWYSSADLALAYGKLIQHLVGYKCWCKHGSQNDKTIIRNFILKNASTVLCFQEKTDQARYYDAQLMDIQRKLHDIRGCRCIFFIRYEHDALR
ncbi:hypothetical protein L2E82_00018 [Cichorium intybus]|uniref:Uncharacterized protein n=1 Tax=Cichorium intybus TaxID=13427 RepID=A0ACB9GXJ6_CICIN|nr:hypothetical protein L2E82_00018 [Cichorium intybus]